MHMFAFLAKNDSARILSVIVNIKPRTQTKHATYFQDVDKTTEKFQVHNLLPIQTAFYTKSFFWKCKE